MSDDYDDYPEAGLTTDWDAELALLRVDDGPDLLEQVPLSEIRRMYGDDWDDESS